MPLVGNAQSIAEQYFAQLNKGSPGSKHAGAKSAIAPLPQPLVPPGTGRETPKPIEQRPPPGGWKPPQDTLPPVPAPSITPAPTPAPAPLPAPVIGRERGPDVEWRGPGGSWNPFTGTTWARDQPQQASTPRPAGPAKPSVMTKPASVHAAPDMGGSTHTLPKPTSTHVVPDMNPMAARRPNRPPMAAVMGDSEYRPRRRFRGM